MREQDLSDYLSASNEGSGDPTKPAVVVTVGGKAKRGAAPKESAPIVLRNGQPLTKEMFDAYGDKGGMPFTSMQTMADWMNTWVNPKTKGPTFAPYYRAYGQSSKIPGSDLMMLYEKHKDNPQVMKIINSTMNTPEGEVPMYGADDADNIRKLVDAMYKDPAYAYTHGSLPVSK